MLSDTQRGDAAVGIDRNSKMLQEAPGCSHHAPAIDDRPRDEWLPAKEDVVGDAEFRDQVELLVNDRDACRFGIAHAGERNGSAIDLNGAEIVDVHAGQDFHQGALAGAVFPHQGVHFPAAQIEIDPAQCGDAGKALGNAFNCQNHRAR